LYNDCIYRHRHTYEFIFMWDADEFISFPNKLEGSLLSWLRATIPANTSGVSLRCAGYEVLCQNVLMWPLNIPNTSETNFSKLYQTYTGYSVFAEDKRPPPIVKCKAEGYCLIKTVIRPLSILAYNVHSPQILYEGWSRCFKLDPSIAFYKHVRCRWKNKV
jgi:Glycosyltransferase family 92